jgi:hypothetical protein
MQNPPMHLDASILWVEEEAGEVEDRPGGVDIIPEEAEREEGEQAGEVEVVVDGGEGDGKIKSTVAASPPHCFKSSEGKHKTTRW